ncbi:hypothetical protein CHS0354_042529 [Potamilus streckersoni]|uniref:SMB domain-containing protein n=1 Tax=Potamilus streckersoni TaxID=2493646 RepID=A0AAE0WCJ3_9BIVA|nr:hypothetical protein CHS0354_042529 [Potamilus streckersoni]
MKIFVLCWCTFITQAVDNSTKIKPDLVKFNLITLPTQPTNEQTDIVLRTYEKCSGPTCKRKTRDSKFQTENVESVGCCANCSCAEDCHRYDRCCPDLLERLPIREEWENRLYECQKAQLKDSSKTPIRWKRYWMISKCPKTFNDSDLINISRETSNDTNLKLNVPVTDIERKLTYRNRYYAICHKVEKENWKAWQSEVMCLSASHRLSTMSIIQAVRDSNDCDVVFKPPLNVEVNECEDVVSDCNITGLWARYDPVVESACHAFTSVFNMLYRNIFCFICNGSPDVHRGCKVKALSFKPIAFSALLNIDILFEEKLQSSENGQCTANEIYDQVKMICRQIVCMEGMSLRNGSCSCVYSTATGGMCYEVFIRFTPLNFSFDPKNFASSLYSNLAIYFRNNTSYIDQLEIYIENVTVVTHPPFFVRYVFFVKDTHHPQSLIDVFLSQDNLTTTFTEGAFPNVQFLVHLDKITMVNGSIVSSQNGLPLTKVSAVLKVPSCLDMDIIQITNFLRCPLIQFSSYGDGEFTRNETGLYFRNLTLWFTNEEFVDSKEDESILMCANDYVGKKEMAATRWEPIINDGIKYNNTDYS